MIVDNLQWMDLASVLVLGFVARRLAGSRVGFLAAARTGEPGPFDLDVPGYEVLPSTTRSRRDWSRLGSLTWSPESGSGS